MTALARGSIAAGLAVVSAVLFGLAFPTAGLWPLAWVALTPYLVALRLVGLRGGLALSAFCGALHGYSVGTWFSRAISSYYEQSTFFGVAFFFFMAATMIAPYYMAFGAAYQRASLRFRLWLPMIAAAAWVAADLGRGRLLTGTPFFIGNPWAQIGYSQVGWDAITQIASVTGVYGISFAIAAVNVGIAESCWASLRRDGTWRTAAAGLGLALLPALGILIYGVVSLRDAPAIGSGAGTEVAIVQGNLSSGSRWRADHYGRNLETYLRSTYEVTRGSDTEVVVWPEAAMTFFLADEPLYLRGIARVLQSTDVELVAGGPYAVPDRKAHYLNSVFLIRPDGEIAGRYDKQYLVPFSEYFPFASIEFLRRRFERVRVFTHGASTPPLPTRAGFAGVLTCNESMLPEVASQRVADGATFLLNPSNDTWLDDDQFSELLFAVTSLRAVEQRRYLVRASTSGPSGIIDPWGRTLVKTERAVRATATGRIEKRSERTLYSRMGDSFALACVFAVAVALTAGRRR
jgi:apolipoprotein N-acyltransferase